MEKNLYTAVALGDTTVIKITRQNFREYVENNPVTVVGLIKNLTAINTLLKDNLEMLIDEFIASDERDDYIENMKSNIAKETLKGGYFFWDAKNNK